jgi:chromosome segregation ATPase
MNSPQNSDIIIRRKRISVTDNELQEKLDLLIKRNQYLEKEYARVIGQLKEEKESVAFKAKDMQILHELEAKCSSLQNKQIKTTAQLNEYHREMQKAKGETIGLRRKINGILGHIKTTLARETHPGKAIGPPKNKYEAIYDENKLLKWKLSVVEGYLAGMFSEEGE